MALTATDFNITPFRLTSGEEIFWLPGDPGVTYTKGEFVAQGATGGSAGLIIRAADSNADPIGSVMKTTVCPANTQAWPRASQFDPVRWNAQEKCLVPIKLSVPAGVQVYKATFANHIDDTVISYSAASLYIAATTGHTADDYPNGALIYVYEGPGAGEVNIVDDYDHTGGAAELLVQLHRPFQATLTSASKYIVLTGEGASAKGISLLGRMDLDDEDAMDASDGANDGDFVVFMDWLSAPGFLSQLTVPVIPKTFLYNT